MNNIKIPLLAVIILLATAGGVPVSAVAGSGQEAEKRGSVLARAPLREQYRESRMFVLLPGQTRVDLGRTFIIAESDSVMLNGAVLEREEDYRINVLRGSMILVAPAAGGERLEVSWSRYPFSFAPVFAARFPGERPPAAGPPRKGDAGSSTAARPNPYRLRLSGSKTVGFSVGSSRGLGIDQSLKVTMVGKLARDLEVKASLTDDNLPVQPEGNTEELKHLDKVYVQVKSRHMEVQLGDFSTGLDWSEFSAFDRELRGASVRVDAAGQQFFASGGIAQGRFKTATFTGRDGVQGPYELLDARRFNGVVILPGTESVLLDGRELRRGSENDYTIDYNRGTVTFTEKITITDDSEIVIDYQMGEDDYERTTVTAGWTSPALSDVLSVRTFFFQEGDSPDQPVRTSITPAEKKIIEEAGDDAGKAEATGVVEVEDADDAYILVPADSIPEHYLFVETGGRYRVIFRQVGSGKGGYETDGFTRRGEVKYRYVGEGMGSYSPGRLLPLPERKRVFTMGLSAEKDVFFADVEGDISQYDKNILSSADDDDNDGGALSVRGGIRGLETAPGTLSITGEYSMLEELFVSSDKPRKSYFYRNWNLDDVPLRGRETITGATLNFEGDSLWNVKSSIKRLSRGDSLSARISDLDLSIGRADSRGARLEAFDSRTGDERDRRAARLGGAFSFWRMIPRFEYDTERYRSFNDSAADTGRYYYQSTFGMAGRKIGGFRADLSYRSRVTDRMAEKGGEWRRDRETGEIRFDAGYTGGSRIIDLFISHRESREIQTGGRNLYDLARVRFRDSWQQAGVTNDIGYRVSSGEDRRLEKAVIFVGENEGDYDEEGREVGQKRGDYMVLYLPGGEVEAIRTVELTWRMSIGRGIRGLEAGEGDSSLLGTIRRNLSVDHFFSVVEKSSTDELARLYLLDPSILQRDDVTLYGKNSFRQEWSFLNDVKRFNLRLIFFREDEEDNRSQGSSTSRYSREIQVVAEAVPSKSITLSWEAGTRLKDTDSPGPGGQNYRIQTLSAAQIAGYRLRPSTKVSLELGMEKRNDEVSGATQTSFIGTPSVSSSIGRKLNVSGFMKITYTSVESDLGKPLFFLEEGLREDWSLIGQYKITRNISFGLNYTGRREKNYLGEVKTVNALKMECRAFF